MIITFEPLNGFSKFKNSLKAQKVLVLYVRRQLISNAQRDVKQSFNYASPNECRKT